MNELKTLRKQAHLTQSQAAELLGVSRKTYQNYESSPEKVKQRVYEMYCAQLRELTRVDETHGILSIEEIRKNVRDICVEYDVKSCILFGSYAKGTASETSDVDFIVDCQITGLDYYGLVEELRQALHKKVDVLNVKQLVENEELMSEVLKDGVRVYESPKESSILSGENKD